MIAGWHHEQDQSYNISANALAPDGFTFSNAETVMYAKAIYKPRVPETKSLEALILDDKQEFIANVPGLAISEVTPIATTDGQKLRSLIFRPEGTGNWEQVSYGEEGDFYIECTISSRTKAGYEKSLPAYMSLIHGYKEKL